MSSKIEALFFYYVFRNDKTTFWGGGREGKGRLHRPPMYSAFCILRAVTLADI